MSSKLLSQAGHPAWCAPEECRIDPVDPDGVVLVFHSCTVLSRCGLLVVIEAIDHLILPTGHLVDVDRATVHIGPFADNNLDVDSARDLAAAITTATASIQVAERSDPVVRTIESMEAGR